MAGEGDEDEDRPDAPLASLAEAVRDRRGRLGEDAGEDADTSPASGRSDVWWRLSRRDQRQTVPPISNTAADSGPDRTGREIPTYPSGSVFVAHGVVTALALIGSIVLYLVAVFGGIPPYLWVLSLPLLTVGLFGAVPLLAWWFRVWQPSELE